jgi:hypothetical protein
MQTDNKKRRTPPGISHANAGLSADPPRRVLHNLVTLLRTLKGRGEVAAGSADRPPGYDRDRGRGEPDGSQSQTERSP